MPLARLDEVARLTITSTYFAWLLRGDWDGLWYMRPPPWASSRHGSRRAHQVKGCGGGLDSVARDLYPYALEPAEKRQGGTYHYTVGVKLSRHVRSKPTQSLPTAVSTHTRGRMFKSRFKPRFKQWGLAKHLKTGETRRLCDSASGGPTWKLPAIRGRVLGF